MKLLIITVCAGLAAPVAANATGAIAVSSNQAHRYGYSYGYPDSRGADARARSQCGPGCRIAVRFSGGCAAYAADMGRGATAWGWGTEMNAGAASSRAMAECQVRAGPSGLCVIRVSVCDR